MNEEDFNITFAKEEWKEKVWEHVKNYESEHGASTDNFMIDVADLLEDQIYAWALGPVALYKGLVVKMGSFICKDITEIRNSLEKEDRPFVLFMVLKTPTPEGAENEKGQYIIRGSFLDNIGECSFK
jgi:hypothetical protein